MTSSLRLLETVALLEDVPEEGLTRGQVGTIVEALATDVWLVEFSDDDGRTYTTPEHKAQQLMALRFAPAQAA